MKRKVGVFSLFTFLGLLAITLLLGALAWAQKKPPKPPPPPADPAIAYCVSGPQQLDLMVMNADGSNQRAIVSERWVDNLNPDWSPDGTQLVFTRCNLKTNEKGIYIVNVDGTGLRKVVDLNYVTHTVAWSPVQLGDGNYKIAFTDRAKLPDGTLEADEDLFIVNLEGKGLVKLTDTPEQEWEVDWSPSGDRIAIETYNPAAPPCDLVVYQIGYDSISDKFSATLLGSVIPPGSLLDIAMDVSLNDWAKTQGKLLVNVLMTQGQPDLWTIDVSYLPPPFLCRLTFTGAGFGSFSPDDLKIVFDKAGTVWVMNSDGSGAKQIAAPRGLYFKGLNWRRNL
jgi:dipeptidyl aminopeptidase/acylaminoacyl peptidase